MCSEVQGSLVGKWVHVAVVRRMTNQNGAVTYKVLVNGNVLETRAYPAGSRLQVMRFHAEFAGICPGSRVQVPRRGDDASMEGVVLSLVARRAWRECF